MVEAAGARACGRNHQSIKYLAATLVGVETIANEFAKKAGALRITVADHSLLRCRIFAECCAAWPVAEIRGKVTDRGQPKTGYRRAFGFIDRLIQTDIESSIHLDRASVGSKPPGLARQRLRHLIHSRAKRECGGMTALIQRAVFQEEARASPSRGGDIASPHDASDRRDRRTKGYTLRGMNVELPTQKGYRETLLQEETVA